MTLSHVDENGKARMVDVAGKAESVRTARAEGCIRMSAEAFEMVKGNSGPKGDVLSTAELAGVCGAKRTAELIPLCHPLQITKIDVKTILIEDGVRIEAETKCVGKTGVEMEALTAVNIALLTIYDMCKAVDKNMIIEGIRLVEKTKI